MNRKKFLGLLGLAAAAPIVAGNMELGKDTPKVTQVQELEPMVGETTTFTYRYSPFPIDKFVAVFAGGEGTMYSHDFDTGETTAKPFEDAWQFNILGGKSGQVLRFHDNLSGPVWEYPSEMGFKKVK